MSPLPGLERDTDCGPRVETRKREECYAPLSARTPERLGPLTPLQTAAALEHERLNPDRVRYPDVGHFSPAAQRVDRRRADGEGLRDVPNTEKRRHDASFPPFPL